MPMRTVNAGAKVFEEVPVSGAEVIHTVHAGRLCGELLTPIFELDIRGRTVLRSADVGLPVTNSWGRQGSFYFREQRWPVLRICRRQAVHDESQEFESNRAGYQCEGVYARANGDLLRRQPQQVRLPG